MIRATVELPTPTTLIDATIRSDRSQATSRQSVPTYFQQPCPACGRRLLVPVRHLGQRVFCSHCGRRFVARDPAQQTWKTGEENGSLLDRAERLLACLESSDGNGRWFRG